MAGRTPLLPEPMDEYVKSVSLREVPILSRIREFSASSEHPRMAVASESSQFLALLIKLMRAKRTIEVGVYMGYSSTAVALALPEDGRIIACDVSDEYTSVARRCWKEAGVEHKIELHVRPAIETLRELIAEGQQGTFDFVFIDADKSSYANYYECALELLRPGGLIAVDNVLWSGRLIDPAEQDADTVALRAFNKKLHEDQRIALTLLPIDDGLTLALKL